MKKMRWTQAAIECYKRGCVCKNCNINNLIDSHCRMKYSVIELVKLNGAPKKKGSCEPDPFTD